MMKRKRRIRLLTTIVSIILILSTMLPQGLIQAKKGSGSVEEVLGNLTDEERSALNQLEATPGFTIHPEINLESAGPVNIIVEFKQDPAKIAVAKAKAQKKRSAVTLAEATKQVDTAHEEFKQAISKWKSVKSANQEEIVITQEYRDAFNGVAMTIPGDQVVNLIETGIVKRIWKNETVQLTFPEMNGEKIKPKMIDSIPQIGVDRLHEEGVNGDGIKVGVIDTGIDYNHPDLTNVYEGYRNTDGEDASNVDPDTVLGWDYVENDADPMETTYQDWETSGQPEYDYYGSSYYTSHGTHVSGTIAGQKDNPVDSAVIGVAPGVDLYSYRVLGPYGSGQTDWVLAGIDKAVKDGMDVINLSLGMNVNDPLSPTSVAVNNAMLSNVVTVVAAGNAGPGEKTVGAPGTAALAITVGASDVSQTIPTFTATADGLTFHDVQLLAKHFTDNLANYQDQSFDVVYVGLGSVNDFANVDVTGKIALIERGELAFDEKIRNAKDAGAVAVIVYNNEEGQIPHYVGENTAYIPSFRLSDEDGEALKAAVENGAQFTFGELGNIQTVGDHLADFSSRGPVEGTYDIKPDVVAPGVAIYSTVPGYINDHENESYDVAYNRMQGTSMASPHVAGVAALILQENPAYSPFDVKAALMNTSVDLQEDYSVYEVGAGRINAYDAVHATTYIKVKDQTDMVEGEEIVVLDTEKGSLVFGSHYFDEGESIEVTKEITIGNRSEEEQTYQLDVAFLQAKDNRQDASENGVELNVEQQLTLPAEQNVDLEPKLTVPSDAEQGYYEGYLRVINEHNPEETYQIPFAIRVTEKGIDFMNLDRHAVPNEWTFHSFLIPFIGMEFRVKSPMETIDVIVTDSETDEPIGYVGSMNATSIIPDRSMYVIQAFMGNVNLFTGDPVNPISEEVTKLPEGNFNLKMIGTDKDGNNYTVQQFVVVDNTPAEITFNDIEPGIIEVDESMYTDEDGYHALWVHTNVYDSTIDVLNENGVEYDQSANIVAYYQNSPFPGLLPVSADGEMKFGVLPEEIENEPLNLGLDPIDLATNVGERIQYTFIKKGTAYGEATYEEEEVKLGDSLTFTLNLNNVEDLISGEFDLGYDKAIYQFKDVQLNEEFVDFAEESNLNVTLHEPTFEEDIWTKVVHVGASINEEETTGFSGDIPFVDVTFEVISDTYYGDKAQLRFDAIEQFTYQQSGDESENNIPVFAHDKYHFISKHSVVNGTFAAEAFMHPDGFPIRTDYEGFGMKVYAKGPDGKTYQGTFDDFAQFEIKGLPVTQEEYEIFFEIPGHLTSTVKTKVGKEEDGEIFGEMLRIRPPMNKAGDINGDGVIDILDVMRVVAKYGKNDVHTDLNKDGIVDETDIRFIETNFLEVGPSITKRPMEKLGEKGLDDFLQALGLEPLHD